AAVETNIGREWWLQPRLALFALETFQKRGFFAADIGAGTMMNVEIEIPAVDIILADQFGVISLVNRRLYTLALADEFATHVNVAGVRPHGETRNQAAFDQQVRVVPHDFAVFAGAGLGLVCVDDEILRAAIRFLRHELPFQAGQGVGPGALAHARRFYVLDDRIAAFFQKRLGAVPGAARTSACQAPVVLAVDIPEDAIFVSEHGSPLFLERGRTADGCR